MGLEVRLFFRASNFASSLVTLILEIAVLTMPGLSKNYMQSGKKN